MPVVWRRAMFCRQTAHLPRRFAPIHPQGTRRSQVETKDDQPVQPNQGEDRLPTSPGSSRIDECADSEVAVRDRREIQICRPRVRPPPDALDPGLKRTREFGNNHRHVAAGSPRVVFRTNYSQDIDVVTHARRRPDPESDSLSRARADLVAIASDPLPHASLAPTATRFQRRMKTSRSMSVFDE